MADNITLNAGGGGAVLATDDVGGVHYQIVKLAFGELDSATLASLTNALPVGGNVAHDAVDSGNPVKTGGVGRTTNPTAVADGDRAALFLDDLGRTVAYPIVPRDRIVTGARVTLTTTAETTLLAAGGAGVFRDVVMILATNDSDTPVRLDFRDATGGTVQFSLTLREGGGTEPAPFRVPWPQTTANNAWTVQASAAATSLYVSVLAVENN